MNLVLRRGTAIDAEASGRIIYDAFKALADKHKFASDFFLRLLKILGAGYGEQSHHSL
jgi:hypothetical protein